jgi:hypothetical protein
VQGGAGHRAEPPDEGASGEAELLFASERGNQDNILWLPALRKPLYAECCVAELRWRLRQDMSIAGP